MKVCDIVRFNGERYFNGAVQTEWFYDENRIERVAKSYVFHGPKYFGVSTKDISKSAHTLIDTASFAEMIADKLYQPLPKGSNNFVMTIAGYGTGKSHLAVCLGALFSGRKDLTSVIADNITTADKRIGDHIRGINNRRNLIIALNGMNNFNLDAEILKCARLSLSMNGLSDDVLKSITRSYDIARLFLEKNFTLHVNSFIRSAKAHGIDLSGTALKEYLQNHVENDKSSLAVINEVYKEVNGDTIQWSRGISAGDILTVLQMELCGPGKPFNKVLILFDEFGRYIEYSAANPTIAGEAALQQIFEAVQAANGQIIFTGFIQSDLSAYLSRIEKTANIVRYVGRYENSEKLYLSSNFETILANLLEKDDTAGFSRATDHAIVKYERFHKKVFEALSRWDKSAQKKAVWTDFALYRSIILKGCYPLHPVTTWLLSTTASWMQQRSTIAFVAEMYDGIKNRQIDGPWMPYIYPVDIVDSGIYNEMLNSEEKGLVQSQYCMLYRDIIVKIGNKLSEVEKKVLQAILVLNIGKFTLLDKEDADIAIRYCTDLGEDEIQPALKSLEEMHGVIAFDENTKTFDLIAEASGFNEFRRIYIRYRISTSASIEDMDSDLLQEAVLSGTVETSFAQEHNISSKEWGFDRKLIDAAKIDSSYLEIIKKTIDANQAGESSRGVLLYAYCNKDRDVIISRIRKLYQDAGLAKYPVIVLFLDDPDEEIIDSLAVKKTIARFSGADKERFSKHIDAQLKAHNKRIIRKTTQMLSKKNMIDEKGVSVYNCRINALCAERLKDLYTMAPPFVFDGFQNKTLTQARKSLATICVKLFDRTLMNIQSYQALTQDEKNRVRSCLSVGVKSSWQVFDNKCNLVEPKDPIIQKIYNEIRESIAKEEPVPVMALMAKYIQPPYGMNSNSVALFVFYYMAIQGNEIYSFYGQEKLAPATVSNVIFKGNKLQIQEFRKIRLQINQNANVDQVAAFCKEVQSCKNIEEYSRMRKSLDALLVQEGTSEVNQSIVAQTKMRLDEGIRILGCINDRSRKAAELIAAAKNSLNLPKFVKVFENLTDFTKPLSEEYDFTCGEGSKNTVRAIKQDAEGILKKFFPAAIESLNCDITQLSQYSAAYTLTAGILEENGYKEYAEAIRQRLGKLKEELLARQKYEKTLAELERDLAMASNLSSSSYRQLSELQVRMLNWRSFVQEAKELPKSIQGPLLSRILTIEQASINEKKRLVTKARAAINFCNNADSYTKLVASERDLRHLQGEGFEEVLEKSISDSILTATERIKKIDSLPENMDDLIAFEANLSKTDGIAVAAETKKKIARFRKEENDWGRKNIALVEMKLPQLSASDCVNWLDRTKVLPNFIGCGTRTEYLKLKAEIEVRLQSCRVDGVVSMFLALNESERKACLKRLNELH